MELRRAHDMGRDLLDRHGLGGWRIAFDKAKRRAGACRYAERTISLSAPLTTLHDEAEVRETILHEIAHALAGPGAAHGPRWQAVARRIGSNAERCVSEDAPRVAGAWLGVCPRGHTADRHRRPERVLLCAQCAGRPERDRVFEWTYHGRPAQMHPNYSDELEHLQAGTRTDVLAIGTRVRITAEGQYADRRGTVRKRGRTRFLVELTDGVRLNVLFAAVEPVDAVDVPPRDVRA